MSPLSRWPYAWALLASYWVTLVTSQGFQDWDLYYTSVNADNFGENTDQYFEFVYSVGNSLQDAQYITEDLYDYTCETELATGIGLIANTTSELAVGTSITSRVYVNFTALDNSTDVYNTSNETTSELKFCFKVSLWHETYRMNYARVQVTATLDLASNFSVSNISIDRPDPGEETDLDVTLDYPLTAYVCDEDNVLLDPVPVLNPGSSLRACITYTSGVAGIGLDSVYNVTITQGEILLQAVLDGISQASFVVWDCPSETLCTVEATIPGDFYADDTQNITMQGQCLMSVGTASRRLQLQGLALPQERVRETTQQQLPQLPSVEGERSLQDNTPKGQFSLEMDLELGETTAPATEPASSSNDVFVGSTTFSTVVGLLLAAWWTIW